MTIIAGDIGGTKTLLRCIDDEGAVTIEQRFDSGAYRTFDDLLRAFLVRAGNARIRSACFAVAGPVINNVAEVTNLQWNIEARSLAAAFHIEHVELINDFHAVAIGVPLLGEDDLVSLQRGRRDRTAPIAILGAGTGLGAAMLTWDGSSWNVISSEGGHADFAPQDEEQARLFNFLHARYGHVSWERVVSGMGLTNIYTFLTGKDEEPKQIAELADHGDADATHTFEIFVDLYGAEAGNMALRVIARGGVFLAGGIAAKNVERFTDGRFIAAFLRKGRFADLLASVPVDLIVNEKVGLIGAAELARRA